MSDSLKIQGVVEVSTEGAESSLNRVSSAADKMAINMTEAGAKAGKAVDQIGEIAKATGEKFTRAESAITGSFKKLAVEAAKGKSVLEGLGNIEFNIAAKGLDPAKFKEMGTVVRQLSAEYAHLETAQARTSGSSGQLASRLQNSSYQLQDFIVQVNGGVDATKALGQQLPQLLVGFGAAGAAIGVVAALLPNIIAAFSNSAEGAKKFSDALSDFDKAVGDVGSTVKSFDMEKLYEEFNNSSSAVRAATIEQIKFQQEYIKTTQLVAGKKFGESLSGMGGYSTLNKLAGSYGSSGAENLAKELGVTLGVAKDLMPVLNGLKSGSEDVSLAFNKFGTTLLGGNSKAIELAQTMATLSKSESDAASASSALSEAQAKMAKGHIVTKKEAEEAAKATKASGKATEEFANLLDKINGKESGLNAEYWNDLEQLNNKYKSGLPLESYSDLVDKLTRQQPFYIKGLKESADATKAAEKSEAEYTKALYANDDALVKKAEALEYEVEFYGKEDSAINAVIASRMSEARAIAEANGAYPEHLAFLDREIEARNRISEASSKKEVLDKSAKEMDEFAKSAARNIQTTFADFLFDPFADGTKSMGEKFAISLRRMMADAASAKLMSALLGDGKKDRGLIGSFDWSKLFSGSSSSSGATGIASLGSSVNTGFANGGVFNSPSLHSYSGQIHDTPQMFKFAQGGVFGEAGPEAIMPLKRDSSGRLGVSSGGGGNVSVQINNYSGQQVQQKEVPDGRGGRRIEVTVGDMVAAEMRRTGSAANKALSQPRMVAR